jgi:hypothetical protein
MEAEVRVAGGAEKGTYWPEIADGQVGYKSVRLWSLLAASYGNNLLRWRPGPHVTRRRIACGGVRARWAVDTWRNLAEVDFASARREIVKRTVGRLTSSVC